MPIAIAHFLSKLGRPTKDWHFKLFTEWHTVMGTLSSKATIAHIEDHTITIGVYDACWLQELYLLSPLLKDRLNQLLDQPQVKELRFKKIGKKVEKKTIKKQSEHKKTSKTIKPLTTTEQSALAKISDPGLQEALIVFRARCHRSVE